MSTVEVIEEYRALWAQAQQETQFSQALLGAVLLKLDADTVSVSQADIQATVEKHRLRVDQDGDSIVIKLEGIEDE